MTSPLAHALSSEGLGGFCVDLRPSQLLIHAAPLPSPPLPYLIGIFVAEIVRKLSAENLQILV